MRTLQATARRRSPTVGTSLRATALQLVQQGRRAEAARVLMRVAEREPDDPSVLVSISALLIEQGEFEPAAGAAVLATRLDPMNAEAHANLAAAIHKLGNSRDALEPAMRAVNLAPRNSLMATNLCAILLTLGLHSDALVAAEVAVRLDVRSFKARSNCSLALESLGRLEEAATEGRAAVALQPESAEARHNLAVMLLGAGQMGPEAWSLYQSRLRLPAVSGAVADLPAWRGEDIAGRTILLHAEQGFGDTLQFVRYVPLVVARGARVILAVQPPLLRLLQHTPGADQVVPTGSNLPAHDVFCPLLSLPGILGTDLATIPAMPALLRPDPALIDRWHPPAPEGLQVGLAWAGSKVFIHDKTRSLPPDLLAPLADIPGVQFHSLQAPPDPIPPPLTILDRMADVDDFADTAAIIAGLDLVICVDTAVAHLAASMGKPVWLLSRFTGCWRWLRDREDSPWYPTLQLYRQDSPGDWAGVIDRVQADLGRLAAA